jgi:type II secretory pathway pseudopilin PulG
MSDTLVAVALAGIVAGFAVQLMGWAIGELATAQAIRDRTRVLGLLYERARVEKLSSLDQPQTGVIGRVRWQRTPDALEAASITMVRPRRVVFKLMVEGAGKALDQQVEAIIWPVGLEGVD